jgi:hypothetical protein
MEDNNIKMGELLDKKNLITEEKNAIKMSDLVPAGRVINRRDVKDYIKKHKNDQKLKKKKEKQEA